MASIQVTERIIPSIVINLAVLVLAEANFNDYKTWKVEMVYNQTKVLLPLIGIN
jgi:hypothetical protein